MENSAVDALALAGSVPSADLSLWTLFIQADIVVKTVMIGLLLASFWVWAIIFDKTIKLKRLNRDTAEFEESFWSGGSLEELYDGIGNEPNEPMSSIFSAAMREWRRSASRGLAGPGSRVALQERVERVMHITLGRELERLERYMTFLASVGATAPFIGLFGTVWGIMNSFQSIAISKNTTLAVVAPGIAEALFATAIGLVAAIPAVVGYNKINSDLNRYAGRLEAFAGEFSAILSRQIEERA